MGLKKFHSFLGIGEEHGNHIGRSKSGAKDFVIGHVDKNTQRKIADEEKIEYSKERPDFPAERAHVLH